ncbi:MAG: metallopeptidase TldD-related protein, partial [Armatimonadota bacterium]
IAADVRDIDASQIAQTAADKCTQSAGPQEIEPGQYDVILEPEAVADMVQFLGWTTFNALACQEGRSPFSGRMGEQVCGENITITDDGLDPRGQQLAFDFEGVPKQALTLIDAGIAANVVYDSYTAGREEGRQSTGHALPAPNTWGPMPINQFVQTGDATVEEMIAEIDRGLLVTRFHYTNVVSPKQSVLTGMTRDGTFMIEDGEIVGGIKNLRFTESILQAFSRVEAIGAEGKLCGRVWAPAMLIRDFNFSGATEF